MSSNVDSSEQNGQAVPAEDKDECFTLQELLEEEESLQADAAAVLGGSDAKNCSYMHGYIDRQAVYACKTCPSAEPSGICLACSYACHEGHELYELYTKRNFRCDCGNEKFGEMKCSLFPAKSPRNENNSYNHNFAGIYCRCDRPYPDPERADPEEMHQCIVCEDWFHLEHIGLSKISPSDTFEEMVCDKCMNECSFLWRYKETIETLLVDDTQVNVVDDDDEQPKAKRQKNEKECKLSTLPECSDTRTSGALWPKGWRRALCSCSICEEMYSTKKVSFLVCPEDTVGAYEERGAKKLVDEKSPDPLLNALNGLGHVQKINLIDGYNTLKDSLTAFLNKQAEQKKVVTAEDINDFFKTMTAARKSKEEQISVPYFCR